MSLICVSLEEFGTILVKLDESPADVPGEGMGPVKTGVTGNQIEGAVTVAAESLQKALDPVVGMSRLLMQKLAAVGPEKVEVEFGVELSAEAGVVLTKAGTGCHLSITLSWSAPKE